ncbi:hypothetical protein ACJBU6_06493 [Exserohilum turcicum]
MRLCAHFAAKHPRTIRNQAHLPPYHPFISINTSRYGTLTADPAGLMNKYSNQFIAALQGAHRLTALSVSIASCFLVKYMQSQS